MIYWSAGRSERPSNDHPNGADIPNHLSEVYAISVIFGTGCSSPVLLHFKVAVTETQVGALAKDKGTFLGLESVKILPDPLSPFQYPIRLV